MNLVKSEVSIICILIVLTIFALLPLMERNQIWNGHDLLFGLQRIAASERAIKDGQWFPRWSDELYGGYGYPLLHFYPPLFSLLAVLLTSLFSVSVFTAAKLLIASSFIFSGIGVYLFLRSSWNPSIALAGALAFLYFPYHVALVYTRGALAEFLALAVLPFCLYALRQLLQNGCIFSFFLSSFTFGLLLLSHNAVWLMATPFLLLYVIIHFEKTMWQRTLIGLLSLAAGMSWTMFYWLPAYWEKRFIAIDNLINAANVNFRQHFIPVKRLFVYDDVFHGIGAFLTALFLLSWIIRPSAPDSWKKRDIWFFRGATLLSFLLSMQGAEWIWNLLTPMQFIGYPWRFMGLAGFFAVCAIPVLFTQSESKPSDSFIAPLLILIMLLPSGIRYASPQLGGFDEEARIGREASINGCSSTVVADEYRPQWVHTVPCVTLGIAKDRFTILEGNPYIIVAESTSSRCELAVNTQTQAKIRMNMIYFPGWNAHQENGTPLPISYNNEFGLMELQLPPGTYGVMISLSNTPVRTLSSIVSLLSGIGLFPGLLVMWFIARSRKNVT